MKLTMCTLPDRDDTLIAYLYDDMEPNERTAFDAHMSACAACRGELAELRGVRSHLKQWMPPEPAQLTKSNSQFTKRRFGWREIPAWAQIAAAVLVLGVSAAIANLEVRYDGNGLSVRTGWMRSAPADAATSASLLKASTNERAGASPSRFDSSGIADASTTRPWRADLTALEQQLRNEFRSTQVRAPISTVAANDDLLRRLRMLVEESERRQQRELALRVAEVVRDLNTQRQADLVKIDRSLGLIQRDTGVEALKQREMINYLVRVSQRQ